ncbi:hypothetical protein HK105_202245 [Polyrhizophydium stewartii]|uniref:Uncharacterized protein n=1 Tax=Polyrhizophydium stewartii TaxID=2732419 RepID=A0ABR4NFL1_9FUNG|nr:hypothetical protein HK105_007060 [Polyrhizophydium stewartii]
MSLPSTPALPASGRFFVKNVVSADTVVLRGKPAGGPPPEYMFSLAYLSAPRLGSAKEPEKEEPFAFEAREFLRRLLVGKEVQFKVEYTTTSNNRSFGSLQIRTPVLGETNVSKLLVKEGWAKVRMPEGKRQPSEDQLELSELETQAKEAKKGMWSEATGTRSVSATFTGDARAFFEKHKGKPIPAVIEQVRDGSTLRVLLLLPDSAAGKVHQMITLSLTGIKAPVYRKDMPNMQDLVEPFAEEAKFFVESRLLQRDVRVVLESVGSTGVVSFSGTVQFPAGNIAEALLAEGLVKLVEWNLSTLANKASAAAYRAAEDKAKTKQLRLWRGYVHPSAGQAGADAFGPGSEYEAVVTRILGADQVAVEPVEAPGKERRVQLASIRGPKRVRNESGFEVGYNYEAQEYLRSQLVGQRVRVKHEFTKPAESEFGERECVTIVLPAGGVDIGEALVSRGLANVVRHRKDDHNRSSAYDQLILAEERAQKASKGVHSTKELPVHRLVDLSASAAKARQHLPYLQRAKSVAAIVDFVASGSRLRVTVPSQSCRLVFVLSGIRAPRTARNANEKSEPYGVEAAEYTSRLVLQREVELIFEACDNVGGFIGAVFAKTAEGHKVNLAVALLEQGLATVHDYSASQSSFTNQLYDAEARAKAARKNIWTNYDPATERAEADAAAGAADGAADADKPLEAHEVVVSEISSEGHIYVQIEGPELHKLETMMADFAAHHSGAGQHATAPMTPKAGDYCSAQFAVDKCWYRARVRKVNGANSYTVQYIDYGNTETVPGSRLRPLPPAFATSQLKAQAVEARLAYLDLPAPGSDFADDAVALIRAAAEGQRLAAQVAGKGTSETGGPLLHLILYDLSRMPAAGSSSAARAMSINEQLASEGLAHVSRAWMKRFEADQIKRIKSGVAAVTWSRTQTPSSSTEKSPLEYIVDAQEGAKKSRINLWQYGDFTADDEL